MDNKCGKYDDIIHMDRPVSKHHMPMPIENRAAQFAPFAALTGYEEAIAETARLNELKFEQENTGDEYFD